jgi:hypothetical protein
MEEVITFLSSLNQITIISFFITFFLLIYQVYLLKKEIRKRKKKIDIPDFKDNDGVNPINDLNFGEKKEKKFTFYQDFFLNRVFIVVILFLVFLSIFVFSLIKNNNQSTSVSTAPVGQEKKIIVSPKIKIYNEKWEEIKEEEIKNINHGEKLFIAIEKINDPNIDMARIKINQGEWDNQSITTNFNKEKNVFYREYQLATTDAFLKIEAQLHSTVDGWLGE